jgi:type IV pilus assembly protein PilM
MRRELGELGELAGAAGIGAAGIGAAGIGAGGIGAGGIGAGAQFIGNSKP